MTPTCRNSSRSTWVDPVPLPPNVAKGKDLKIPTNANQGGGKRRGNVRAMNEVKPDAGTPPLFYSKPVNDKGGPCHAPDFDHRSSCMLQMKQQQHTKDGKTVTHQDHFRCTITCGYRGKRRHYEHKCHIKKRESDKLKRQEAERQKNQTPTRNPKKMGIKVVKEVARGVAKVDPLTSRGAHQRPRLFHLLPKGTPRSAHRGITPPLRGITPRRGNWPGWPSPSWLQGWMSNSLLRSRGAAPKRSTWFSGSS